ncbi:MAG: hypothetical protein ABI838_06395, partial [Chloroflexota bacterium]
GATTCAAGAAFAGNPTGQWKGSWVDGAAVPVTPTDPDIEAAALRAVQYFGFHKDAVYFVMTPTAHSESGFGTNWCAWHSSAVSGSNQVPYTYLPYQPDAGSKCGVNAVNPTDAFGHGIFDGLSIVGGHEYLEAITDPFPNSGWLDSAGQENADKCQWSAGPVANYTFGSTVFAVQPTWSNASASCAMSLGSVPTPTPTPTPSPTPTPAPTGWTGYFSWFDNASTGVSNDNIHIVNPLATATTGYVTLGSTSVPFSVAAGDQTYVSLPQGMSGGPLRVSAGSRVIATQRVQYFNSFNEVSARTAADAAADLWLPWYDHSSPGMSLDEIHVVNPSVTAITGTITVGTPAFARGTFTVSAYGHVQLSFPVGVIGGPVKVHADTGAVLATQRVRYYQTFNETVARSAAESATTLYFNWYDHASPGMSNDNVHVINTTGAVVTGSVRVGGAASTLASTTFTIPAYGTSYVGFGGAMIGGPVTVTASGNVLASQRVQYFGSFNEVSGRAASDAGANLYMPWYDVVSPGMLNDNIHLLNPSSTPASGTVTVAGRSLGFTVAGGGEWFGAVPGVIGGPVRVTVTSGPGVLASQRVQYGQSFNEAEARS